MHQKWPFFLLFSSTLICPLYTSSMEPSLELSQEQKMATFQWIQTALVEAQALVERQEYKKLKPLYSKIWQLQPELYLSESQLHDFRMTCAYCPVYTKEFDLALRELQKIDDIHLNSSQSFKKQFMISKVYFMKGEIKEAARLLHSLQANLPLEKWGAEDRSYLLKVLQKTELYFQNKIKAADTSFQAQHYSEALPLYQEITQGIRDEICKLEDQKLEAELYLRLAQSHFLSDELHHTKKVLEEAHHLNRIDLDGLYLLTLTNRELGAYKEAMLSCQEYLFLGPHYSPEQLEAVEFEQAHLHFLLQNYQEAEHLFIELLTHLKSTHFLYLSRFFMAKILIERGEPEKVETWLAKSNFNFEKYPNLKGQWAYLRAEAFFQSNQYSHAIQNYELALAQHDSQKQDWALKARHHLAHSYLKLAEEPCTQDRQINLAYAEKAFEKILSLETSEQASLGLAKVYALKSHYFDDPSASKKMKDLIQRSPLHDGLLQLKLGWIQADLEKDLSVKEEIYKSIELHEGLSAYDQSMHSFFRAKNLFQLANQNQQKELFNTVANLLDSTWKDLYSNCPSSLSQALKMKVLSLVQIGEESALKEGWGFLDHFFDRYPSYKEISGAQEEVLYFQAFLASQLFEKKADVDFFEKAIRTLEQLIGMTQKEAWKSQALYLLGSLYFQGQDYPKARHTFSKLIENYPQSKWVADSWYWAAKCHDLEQHDPKLAQSYRRKVYEDYPNSSHAAQAYFYAYPMDHYLEGKPEALAHLKEMKHKFSHSPYLSVSYYLQAFQHSQVCKKGDLRGNESHLLEAIKLFELAIESFQSFYLKGNIASSQLKYLSKIYYQSVLEKAHSHLEYAEVSSVNERATQLEHALQSYKEFISDFKDQGHPLAHFFFEDTSYPSLLEEAEFGLSKAYIKNFQLLEGEKKLKEMLTRYQQEGVEKTSIYSKACLELALISMAREDFLGALEALHQAQLAPSEELSIEQILEIGIQESLCYRFSGQHDLAILALSKVINRGSSSNLQVKAMYLRAELYELQGKKELAQKQFEEAAKKEGEWARMSQDRLIAHYDLD